MTTILNAFFANAAHDAAVVDTVEHGLCLVASADAPELWKEVLAFNPAAFAPPPSARQVSRKTWNDALDAAGRLSAWLALMSDPAVKPKDAAYLLTGSDSGDYIEDNPKLARLAAKAGVDVTAAFNAATAVA